MHTWPAASSDLHPQTRGHGLGATPLRWLLIACASLIGALGVLVMPATSLGQAGTAWTSQTSPAGDNGWQSVTYGNGLFVAVAFSGTGNRVMTSPDGSTWTIRTSAADNQWISVTYGNGLFVAVAQTGSGNRVMTSPNGINWTIRTSAANNQWRSVTYGNGLFVAVANFGTGNRVMTSPNGINWTSRLSAADSGWQSVTYGNGLFVAVAQTGTINNKVMTSPDGITWTSQTAAADNQWFSVTYGNGLFVAVAWSGTGNRVMTSPNGSTWTSRLSAADNNWQSVTYDNGLFVAVASTGTNNQVMTSGTLIPPTPATPTATAGNAQATITVAQGSGPGGTPFLSTVTAVGDNTKTCTVTGASGPCTIIGLTNGTSYTFTATASNAGGTSAPSGASAAVTPTDVALTPTAPVNTFTMKILKIWHQKITTRLNLPGPGKVVQVGTTRQKARTVTVCTARKTVATAGKVTITCRLSAKARAARKTHSLKVRLVTTFTPTGGTAKSISKTLVLKKTR